MISRRKFLKDIFAVLIAAVIVALFRRFGGKNSMHSLRQKFAEGKNRIILKEAMYCRKLKNKAVQCLLCFRNCVLNDGQRSYCKVRLNDGGTLYSLVYGKAVFAPIQEGHLPLVFSALPAIKTLKMGTAGCNMQCKFCYAWQVSQAFPEDIKFFDYEKIFNNVDAVAKATPATSNGIISPEQVIQFAKKADCGLISYALNEPTVCYEYCLDIAAAAKKNGIMNQFLLNGFINKEPLAEMVKYADLVSVGIKGFDDDVYRNYCSSDARLEPVLKTLMFLKKTKIRFDIFFPVIPTVNDKLEQIRNMVIWIKENLGEEIPLHYLRYVPAYRLAGLPPTSLSCLESLRQMAETVGMKYVYIYTINAFRFPDLEEKLYCPHCKKLLLCRKGMGKLTVDNTSNGRCIFCGRETYPLQR